MKEGTVDIVDLAIGYPAKKGDKVVARHLTASIYKGELTCLIGANGVGKSTLLRTLSGFQPKLSGEILVLGKPIESYSDKERSKLIGVVLTEKVEARDMTVYELVSLGRSPYTGFWGGLSADDDAIIREAISAVRMDAFTERPVQTLSDGERQKVMIAKSLAQQTPIIYLDEPTAFLDYPSKVDVMQLLRSLAADKGKTIFLSTHDLELALQLSDRLWLMDRRKGLEVGSPAALAKNGSLSDFFHNEHITFDKENLLYRIAK